MLLNPGGARPPLAGAPRAPRLLPDSAHPEREWIGKELGLGVVNPRSDEIETPAQIRERVRAAMRCVSAERLFLNPDCGFGTFAARPMNTSDVAARKLATMVEAARTLREESGDGWGRHT